MSWKKWNGNWRWYSSWRRIGLKRRTKKRTTNQCVQCNTGCREQHHSSIKNKPYLLQSLHLQPTQMSTHKHLPFEFLWNYNMLLQDQKYLDVGLLLLCIALAISMSLGLSFPGKLHQRSRSKFHSTQNGVPKVSKNFILDISMPGAHPLKVKVLILTIEVEPRTSCNTSCCVFERIFRKG